MSTPTSHSGQETKATQIIPKKDGSPIFAYWIRFYMKSFFVAAPFSAQDKIFLSEISAAMVKKILEKGQNCTEKRKKLHNLNLICVR